VSLGRFQAIDDSVDLEACRREGVDVVRRISGGGSVFHGRKGEVTYSIVLREEHLPARDVVSSFEYLLGGVAGAIRATGLQAEVSPINDIVVNGRKIGGSAQVRRNGGVLQHGTVLLTIDKHLAFRLLKVPSLKMEQRSLVKPEDRVTSMNEEGVHVTAAHLRRILERSFSKALNAEFSASGLTEAELRASKEYAIERYSHAAWTESR
jgi:lipoate-protein ligase A